MARARLCRNRCDALARVTVNATRSNAVLAIIVMAQPDAKPTWGARCGNGFGDTATRATVTQVGEPPLRRRLEGSASSLAAALGANEHLAGSPVDVVQGEGRDLAGPHAELRQDHENGVVSSTQSGRLGRNRRGLSELAPQRDRSAGSRASSLIEGTQPASGYGWAAMM